MGASRRDDEFREFVASRSAALFRLAFLLVGDYHQAQDLVQESLAKVYVAWPRLREAGNAEAYTRRVLATTVTSWRRRRSFHERPVELLPDAGSGDPAFQVAIHDALGRYLLELPARQRAAVVLRHYADLSEAQTAEAMGCSVGTVKSSTAAGLKRLRERVGSDLELRTSDEQAVVP